MAIDSIQYPKYLKWYNSERREVIPGYQYLRYSANQFRTHQSTFNEFTIDASDTDASNYKELTLFTFSNGVSIRMRYYRVGDNIMTMWAYYSKDGSLITLSGDNLSTWTSETLYASSKYNNNYAHYTFYYTPPQILYGVGSNENPPDYFAYMGSVWYLKDNSSPYEPPEIMGIKDDFDRANLGIYYNMGIHATTAYDRGYKRIISIINGNGDGTPISPILPSEDTSTQGGGDSADPAYNPFSDPINFPDLPTGGSALASGFIKLYRPTSGELNQLAAKLWSDSFIEEIKKIQNDPLEAIISLHSVPFGIVGASRQSCRIGNYDSEITMDTIGAQFYTVDCGNISIPEHWASALDYAPYTDIEIYLPFCGVKPLQIDDVMNRVINVKYNIDILTGAAICMVKCGDSVLYTYNTEIAQNIPMSASNHAQLYQSIISAASAVVGVASGGAGAVVGAVQSAATVAASKHSQVSRGGSLGGSVGVLGDFVPYLIIHRPIQSLAADFAHKKGYPSNITATLSSVSGYTEVDSIHLENIPCTDMERVELYRILQEGVIL